MSASNKDENGQRAGLTRRGFLGVAVTGGAALTVGRGLAGQPSRSVPTRPGRAQGFELSETTIAELQQAMETGRHTARSLCELYLARIDENDRRGPSLHSMLDLNPDALQIAERLDAERRANGLRGPLHGVPIVIKDNIDSADRMTTTAGSLALEGSIPRQDAFIVRRLREAGAIVLGKTNLSEWANFRSTASSSGWSGRGGQCRNPYALNRSPCGSSSGTGAAVSANFAAVGIGTETDGSVVCPSSASGLVGIKPTLGLVSRSGIIPIAHSQDTAGPMARTVADAAILLGAITGVDPDDEVTRAAGARVVPAYTSSLDVDGLRNARIGVAREHFFGYSPEADRIVDEAIDTMRQLGAVIVDPANIPNVGEYEDSEFEVLLYEFKADLNAYLARLPSGKRVRTLADVIEFNEANRDREMPFFGQEIMHMAQEKGPLTDRAYRDALTKNHRLSREEGIDAVMDEHRLEAIVAPTGSPAWSIDLVNGDHFLGASSAPAAVAGYPNITVPAGEVHGLPVGISIMGRAFSEATLIRLAYAFERATTARTEPAFRPTAAL